MQLNASIGKVKEINLHCPPIARVTVIFGFWSTCWIVASNYLQTVFMSRLGVGVGVTLKQVENVRKKEHCAPFSGSNSFMQQMNRQTEANRIFWFMLK